MRALIVEPGYARGALAAARGLANAGWIVGIGSPERGGLAASSRHSHSWHRIPPPERDLKAFLKATNAAITDGGFEVVFGAGDAEVLALSAARDTIRAHVPYAPHESLVRAFDKLDLASVAADVGLASPRTEEATPDAIASADYPVVVKARLHWQPGAPSATARLEARLAPSPREAEAFAESIRAAGGEALLQEAVWGPLLAYAVVIDRDGRVVADVQQRADRTWPPDTGVSVRAVTVPVDADLAERVAMLLAKLDWFGLAHLQFLLDERGEARVIDLNGRFYGSLALAVASGANLPDAWARLGTGRPPATVPQARPGVRYQWLEGDLRRAFREQRSGLGTDVSSCLRYAPWAAHSTWQASDPWPTLRHAARLAARAVRKALT